MKKSKVSIILGAGFSRAAGLPLASEIFASAEFPPSRSETDRKQMEGVKSAFETWKKNNPDRSTEEWLALLYDDRENPLSNMLHQTSWEFALQYVLRRLSLVRNAHPDPYYHGISRFNKDGVHKNHQLFWEFVRTFELDAIVTTNYDILAERALHHTSNDGRTYPLFSYGGFPHRQSVRKMTNVTKNQFEDVFLGTDYLIYKLHGSLNWAHEKHSANMKIHDDVRAAFRMSDNIGTSAIVPPIPEKELPKDFRVIWDQAEAALIEAEAWIVCGYSMPEYDRALRDWFQNLIGKAQTKRIAVLDPQSTTLLDRWRHPDRKDIEIRGFAGLPNGVCDALENFVAGVE